MKYILFILTTSILALSSCGSSTKVENQDVEEDQVVEEIKESETTTFKMGKVQLDQEGCEIFILTTGANKEKLYPVGLDDMFRVNGAILQFEYDPSRAPLPEGCEDCKAVVLRSITRVKH